MYKCRHFGFQRQGLNRVTVTFEPACTNKPVERGISKIDGVDGTRKRPRELGPVNEALRRGGGQEETREDAHEFYCIAVAVFGEAAVYRRQKRLTRECVVTVHSSIPVVPLRFLVLVRLVPVPFKPIIARLLSLARPQKPLSLRTGNANG